VVDYAKALRNIRKFEKGLERWNTPTHARYHHYYSAYYLLPC
jgi:hypothetical protein